MDAFLLELGIDSPPRSATASSEEDVGVLGQSLLLLLLLSMQWLL